jgi:hypothetical protein
MTNAKFAKRNTGYNTSWSGSDLERSYHEQFLVGINDEPGQLSTFQHFVNFSK